MTKAQHDYLLGVIHGATLGSLFVGIVIYVLIAWVL